MSSSSSTSSGPTRRDSITALSAALHTFVPGRRLDDDAMAFIRLAGGATGTLTCSQVCVGQENALRIRLFGEQVLPHFRA